MTASDFGLGAVVLYFIGNNVCIGARKGDGKEADPKGQLLCL